MADDEPVAAANDSQQQETGGNGGDRLDRVESKVDRLADLVAKILPGSHGEAEQRTEDRLDRPSTVAEQVRAELDRAAREQADADAASAEKSEREQVRAELAALREKPPQAPTPKRTRMLGWGA